MKIQSKIVSWAVSLLFAAAVAALCLLALFRESEKYSFFENRNLVSMPELKKEDVLSGRYFSDVEKYLGDHAPLRRTLVKLNCSVDLFLGKPVVNDVVVTKNALLSFKDFEGAPDPEKIGSKAARAASNVAAHRDTAEEYGGRFCYVAIPCQYVCLEDRFPWYIENRADYTRVSSEAMFRELRERGVDYIDIKEDVDRMTDEERSVFSSAVDNHSSIFGAYLTYRRMMDKVNADWGGGVEVLEEGEYSTEKVPNPYLGSRGRKLFDLIGFDESLYTITPKEKIPFKEYYKGTEVAPKVYYVPKNPYETVLYSMYMNGDNSFTEIDTGREDLPSVLIYGDSFTNAVECILWYGFDKMYSVDLRSYKDKSIDDVIRELRPDYVFCVRDYEALIDTTGNGR